VAGSARQFAVTAIDQTRQRELHRSDWS